MIGIYAVGAVISAFLCAKKLEMRGFLAGIAEAAVYSVIILLSTFILSGYNFSVYLIVSLCVNLLFGTAAGIAAKNVR